MAGILRTPTEDFLRVVAAAAALDTPAGTLAGTLAAAAAVGTEAAAGSLAAAARAPGCSLAWTGTRPACCGRPHRIPPGPWD